MVMNDHFQMIKFMFIMLEHYLMALNLIVVEIVMKNLILNLVKVQLLKHGILV